MRVIVTGSREWDDQLAVEVVLRGLRSIGKRADGLTIVHGAAKGLDHLAEKTAKKLDIKTDPHPADWDRFGLRAGLKRNKHMADLGAQLVIGFLLHEPKHSRNAGTRDMLKRARMMHIQTIEVWA